MLNLENILRCQFQDKDQSQEIKTLANNTTSFF